MRTYDVNSIQNTTGVLKLSYTPHKHLLDAKYVAKLIIHIIYQHGLLYTQTIYLQSVSCFCVKCELDVAEHKCTHHFNTLIRVSSSTWYKHARHDTYCSIIYIIYLIAIYRYQLSRPTIHLLHHCVWSGADQSDSDDAQRQEPH
jgi:hypothetical protein